MGKYDDIIKQYRMIYDHHTHTIYSHGKGTILDNVRVAAAKGIRSIAITDHGEYTARAALFGRGAGAAPTV